MTRISPAFAAIFLFAATVAAASAPAKAPVELLVEASSSPAVQIDVLQVEPRLGRDLEIFLRLTNVSEEPLEIVEISVVQRDGRNRARAFESFLEEADLQPGEGLYLIRRTSHFTPRPGEVFSLSVQPYLQLEPSLPASEEMAQPGRSDQAANSSCASFAEHCTANAALLCGQADLSYYECKCGNTGSSQQLECSG